MVPRPGNIECALLGDCCQHGGGVADQGAGQAEQDGVDICGGQGGGGGQLRTTVSCYICRTLEQLMS